MEDEFKLNPVKRNGELGVITVVVAVTKIFADDIGRDLSL